MIEIVHQTVGRRTLLAAVNRSPTNIITITLGDEYPEIIKLMDRDDFGVPYIFKDILSAVREELFNGGGFKRETRLQQ